MFRARTIASISYALLVLISSTSFMVSVHFCSGHIQNVALFTKAEGCEKEKSLPPCHRHETSSCCNDEMLTHDGEDFTFGFSEVNSPCIAYVSALDPNTILSEVIPSLRLPRVKHLNYDAPLRACDLTVAHRVFLI